MDFSQQNKVFFVGAGPGDPDLLTIKAVRILSKAEVVITDRLVSEEILIHYVHPAAKIIYVGKQGGSFVSASQKDINDLLVEMAGRYKNVIRLKGGDVSLFSNILDELHTLIAASIPYEIIPGITALSGAAAYSGIPLTARGYATGVKILTYYQNTAISDEAWKDLATFEDTLVFYMSAGSLYHVVRKLLENNADPTISFVVVEQATTPNQHVHAFTLQEFFYLHQHTTFISPSLVIIGKVTTLHQQFAWLPNNNERVSYFSPLKEFAEPVEFAGKYQTKSYVSNT